MDGRRIFFTGRAFRKASSICAPPFRSTSLSRTALLRWKETGHSTAPLVLWERSYLRMTRLLPMQPAHDSWGSNPEESCTSARVSRFLGNASPALIDLVGETVNAPATSFQVVPEFRHLRALWKVLACPCVTSYAAYPAFRLQF